MTLTLEINNSQHFKCVLLDFDSNLGRVSLKREFSLSLKVTPKIFVLFYVEMKQNIQPIAAQENA